MEKRKIGGVCLLIGIILILVTLASLFLTTSGVATVLFLLSVVFNSVGILLWRKPRF